MSRNNLCPLFSFGLCKRFRMNGGGPQSLPKRACLPVLNVRATPTWPIPGTAIAPNAPPGNEVLPTYQYRLRLCRHVVPPESATCVVLPSSRHSWIWPGSQIQAPPLILGTLPRPAIYPYTCSMSCCVTSLWCGSSAMALRIESVYARHFREQHTASTATRPKLAPERLYWPPYYDGCASATTDPNDNS